LDRGGFYASFNEASGLLGEGDNHNAQKNNKNIFGPPVNPFPQAPNPFPYPFLVFGFIGTKKQPACNFTFHVSRVLRAIIRQPRFLFLRLRSANFT
jgi:hypothetical protein